MSVRRVQFTQLALIQPAQLILLHPLIGLKCQKCAETSLSSLSQRYRHSCAATPAWPRRALYAVDLRPIFEGNHVKLGLSIV